MDLATQLHQYPNYFTQNNIENRRRLLRRLKSRIIAQQNFMERAALRATRFVGTTEFFLINLYVILLWIVLQSNIIPGVKPFDPFPFVFLITSISIETIFLTICILISQHQQEKFETLREQITLQFDIITEEEITKLMQLMVLMAQKQGIDVSQDNILLEMLKPIDLEQIEKTLERQIDL